jgi:hypothetical protein
LQLGVTMPRLRIRQLCPLAAVVLLTAFVPAAGQALAAQGGPHLRAPLLSAASIRDAAGAATAAPAGLPPALSSAVPLRREQR